jgi:hypothetical protein
MTLVSPLEAPAGVSDAIRKASEATGTDFDYLLTTAARESNFQARARAETSSAAGLFQFIESTWLQTVKEEGDRFGLDKYGPHIQRTESGNYTVPNPELREEILGLRHDPEVAATPDRVEAAIEKLGLPVSVLKAVPGQTYTLAK